MEVKAKRNMLQQHVRVWGWDSLLENVKELFPDLGIYAISTSWYDSEERFNLKGWGTKGDLLIKLY